METLNDYELYHGIDASNEVSLFEYGLLVKYNEKDNDFHCIYRYGEEFSSGWISEKDVNELVNKSWINKKEFFNYLGITESDYIHDNFVTKLYNLISYYGIENIMGSSYYTYPIGGIYE